MKLNTLVVSLLVAMLCIAVPMGFMLPATAAPSMASAPSTRGQIRIGSFVSAGYAVSAPGRFSQSAFDTLRSQRALISLPDPDGGMNAVLRSVEGTLASTAAATTTGSVRLWQVKEAVFNGVREYDLAYLGDLGYTIGAITGSSVDSAVTSSERLAVNFTWTKGTEVTSPPGIADYIVSAYGGAGLVRFNPGGTTPARFNLTDCGNARWILVDAPSTSGASIVVVAEAGN